MPNWSPTPEQISTPEKRAVAALNLVIAQVKQECGRRIEEVLPDYKQRNALALFVETIQLHGPDTTQWPEELQATNTALMAKWAEIKRLRTRSNEIEAQLRNGTIMDIHDDATWA